MLIVDDEPVIADTLVKVFSVEGYQARSAYSAEAAIEIIPVWRPDLAIIDVILPRLNGIDLAIQIEAESPHCRVALFSGASATSEVVAGASLHSFEVLPKPIHPAEMLTNASRLLSLVRGCG